MALNKQFPAKILAYFGYGGLKPGVEREVGEAFLSIGDWMDNNLPDCAEKSAGLRKLLEARDCMLRAAVTKE